MGFIHPDAQWVASPNASTRRNGASPDIILLHYTNMETAEAALERLCDPEVGVSSHYLISESGHLWQMVDEAQRAHHAGVGAWGDVDDVNSRSIGIELANRGDHAFSEPQMRALEALLPGIMARWSVPAARVIGHSDMAPERKIDPGPRFDWRRLALQGFAVWPIQNGHLPVNADGFRADLRRIGYPDVSDALLLSSFRLRFRPWGAGPLDGTDMALARDVAVRWPV